MKATRGALLPSVTGARFLAAAAVMFGHIAGLNPLVTPLNAYKWWEAVPFFFLLSGFILAHVYPSLDDWAARKQFLVARFARIYPLHLVTFLLLVLLIPAAGRTPLDKIDHLVRNLTLTQSWSGNPDVNLSFNGPAWSISVEFFFYACFPLLIYKWRYTWWLWLPISFHVVQNANVLMPHAAESATLPLRYVFLFTVGMAMAGVYRWLEPRVRCGLLVGTILEVAALTLVYYRESIYPKYYIIGPALAFASVVMVAALGRGCIARLLATRPLVVLGEASFALYLFHQVFMRWMLCQNLHLTMNATAHLALYVAVSLAGSLLLWRFVECPARRGILALYNRRWFKPAETAAPAVQPGGAVAAAVPSPHFLKSPAEAAVEENWLGISVNQR